MHRLVALSAPLLLTAGLFAPAGAGPIPAPAEEQAPAKPFRFDQGEVGIYAGSFSLKQGSAEAMEEQRVQSSLVYRVRAAEGAKATLLVVRLAKERGEKTPENPAAAGIGDEAAFGRLQHFAIEKGASKYTVEALEEDEIELDQSQGALDLFCPLESLFLPAAIPEEGQEKRSREEVSIFGLGTATVPLLTTVRREEGAGKPPGGLALQREIEKDAGAKAAFEFQGNPATLLGWRELLAFGPADSLAARVERDIAFEIKIEDSSMRVEAALRLERLQRVLPAAEEAKKLDDLEARCGAVARDFNAHKPSTEIEKRVLDLAGAARGTLLADAAAALKLRLGVYRSFFEESEEGQRLAQILGKPAPDFTLEDLQGKRVKFREAIAGKVTLLSFWGYG